MTITSKRILCVGKIVDGPIDWRIAPPPANAPKDMFVSRYMNSVPMLETPNNLWWDGFYAQVEGQPLAAMPTEQQEVGWWASQMSNGEADRNCYNGSIEDDNDFNRMGGA